MSNSLQDQLLKSGLVSEKKLKIAKQTQRKQTKQKKSKKASSEELSLAACYAKKAQAEKFEKDKALNQAREAAKAKKALKAKVKDLLLKHRCNDDAGEVIRRFVDGERIRQIYVNDAQQQQLIGGQLAVVLFNGRTHLVPREVAEKIHEFDYDKVFFLDKPQLSQTSDTPDTTDADDPYGAYQIPDDLMW